MVSMSAYTISFRSKKSGISYRHICEKQSADKETTRENWGATIDGNVLECHNSA